MICHSSCLKLTQFAWSQICLSTAHPSNYCPPWQDSFLCCPRTLPKPRLPMFTPPISKVSTHLEPLAESIGPVAWCLLPTLPSSLMRPLSNAKAIILDHMNVKETYRTGKTQSKETYHTGKTPGFRMDPGAPPRLHPSVATCLSKVASFSGGLYSQEGTLKIQAWDLPDLLLLPKRSR